MLPFLVRVEMLRSFLYMKQGMGTPKPPPSRYAGLHLEVIQTLYLACDKDKKKKTFKMSPKTSFKNKLRMMYTRAAGFVRDPKIGNGWLRTWISVCRLEGTSRFAPQWDKALESFLPLNGIVPWRDSLYFNFFFLDWNQKLSASTVFAEIKSRFRKIFKMILLILITVLPVIH